MSIAHLQKTGFYFFSPPLRVNSEYFAQRNVAPAVICVGPVSEHQQTLQQIDMLPSVVVIARYRTHVESMKQIGAVVFDPQGIGVEILLYF